MSRRVFLKSLTELLGGFIFHAVLPIKLDLQSKLNGSEWKTLQISPVAGFQYYQGEALWLQLATGQPVTLVRETGNPYDERAVRIEWLNHKLGYIPAIDNAAVSQLMDRGETISASIVGLKNSKNPWDRIEVEVRWRV